MGRELFAKLFEDECFKTFCCMVDELRNKEHKIKLPLETVGLLYATNVDCVKGDEEIGAIHNLVKSFLNPDDRGISKTSSFYDYLSLLILYGLQIGTGNSLRAIDSGSFHWI